MPTFGAQLQSAFRTRAVHVRGEVALFRALIEAATSIQGPVVAKEYHGTQSHVLFSPQWSGARAHPRCELADLLLLSYRSGAARSVRMTWLQAKVTSNDLSCASPMACPSFHGNTEQWDLLAHRPVIRGATSSFQPPGDLLSAAILPSVGSFGAFYPSAGAHDLAYYVADLLCPTRTGARYANLAYVPTGAIRTVGGYQERTTACCLEELGEAIAAQLVGSPVLSWSFGPAHEARRAWLGRLLSSWMRNPDPGHAQVARELRQVLEFPAGDEPIEVSTEPPLPARTALIVRVDSAYTSPLYADARRGRLTTR